MAVCSCCGSDKEVSDIVLDSGNIAVCPKCQQELLYHFTMSCFAGIIQARRMGASKKEAIEAVFGTKEADMILASDKDFEKMFQK